MSSVLLRLQVILIEPSTKPPLKMVDFNKVVIPSKESALTTTLGLPWLRGHRHLTENKDLKGCGFNPQQPMPAIFQPWIAKKINQAPSVRVIVICSDHRLLWRDSYKGVDRALTPDESILHKIIIIIIIRVIFISDCFKRAHNFLFQYIEAFFSY